MQSTTTTHNNLFEHKTQKHKWFLAFKLLMLIIVKTIIYFNFKLTFVLAFQLTAATSN